MMGISTPSWIGWHSESHLHYQVVVLPVPIYVLFDKININIWLHAGLILTTNLLHLHHPHMRQT